jgi:hypothetical protein
MRAVSSEVGGEGGVAMEVGGVGLGHMRGERACKRKKGFARFAIEITARRDKSEGAVIPGG